MAIPGILFQPLERALSRPDGVAPTARAASSTVIGWLAVLGGLIGGLDVLAPGVLVPGWRTWLFAAMMTVLVALGIVLLKLRRAGRHAVTALVLMSFPIYVVVCQCVVDAATYAPPLMMLFGAISGAAMLEVRAFIVNCFLLVAAVATTLIPTGPGPRPPWACRSGCRVRCC